MVLEKTNFRNHLDISNSLNNRATKCSISSFFPNACGIFVPLSKLNP